MNPTALLWLSVISTGLGSILAAWTILNKYAHRIIVDRAVSALGVTQVAARTKLPLHELISYAPLVIGFIFALKLALDGAWILASCLLLVAMMLIDPVRTWMKTRTITDTGAETDFALICIECSAWDKTVLQTLDEASAVFEHPKLRKIVQDALERIYNGATENEVLQHLVSEQTSSIWALLIWTLLEQRQMNDSTKLRNQVTELVRQRFVLEQRARPALALLRRKLAILLILCATLATYLTISPAMQFYTTLLQTQVIGAIAILILAWITCVSSAQLETLERIME